MSIRMMSLSLMALALTAAGALTRADEPASARTSGFVLGPGEGEVLHMGPPTGGRVVVKVDPAKTGSPHLAMGMQHLNDEIPLHRHEHEDELLFLHAGRGTATLGDAQVAVGPGTTVYVPAGTWHGVKNTGDEPAQVLWLVAAEAGKNTQLEKFFRVIGSPPGAEVTPLTPEQMADVMHEHGMQPRMP